MIPFCRALEANLRTVVSDIQAELNGIPDADLNTWLPAIARDGGAKMNTFAAICLHTASAGEYMTLHAVGRRPMDRDREAEFSATGSRAEIDQAFDTWLTDLHGLLESLGEDDLGKDTIVEKYTTRGMDNAGALLHALDHAALHLGHIQIQRQLWEAERTSKPPSP